MVGAFAANARQARRLRDGLPDASYSFAYQTSRAVGMAVILLLIMGSVSHNLYRFNWIWFGAFQGIAVHCMRRLGSEEGDWALQEGCWTPELV
jgi:hypothetical protein